MGEAAPPELLLDSEADPVVTGGIALICVVNVNEAECGEGYCCTSGKAQEAKIQSLSSLKRKLRTLAEFK